MRLAFVTPRFGPGVLGGSEAVMAEAASGFAERGHDVEVLTTCALDHYSWANELPEGVFEEKAMLVRRFLAERRPSRAALSAQLAIQAGQVPDLDHQVSWLGFHFAVPGLFEHLLRFGPSYDALVFSPYLFWTTTACLPLVADRAVVMPCLHDETYARLDVVRPVLASPALLWFLSAPEHALAHRLGPLARRHVLTGAGVPVPRRYDPEGFRRRHGLERPYVVFAGRREGGKGLSMLLEALRSVLAGPGGQASLDLVVIGKGDPAAPLRLPPELEGRVVDLGFVDDAERDDAFAGALALLQPSEVESFSRTAMEAWLAGRPVVALAANEVLAWHCRRSGGGLLFSDAASLGEALHKLVSDPALVSKLGTAGRLYVLGNYTWPDVLDRMEASLGALGGGPPAGARPAVAAEDPAGPGAAHARPAATAKEPAGAAHASAAGEARSHEVRRYLVAGSYPPLPGEASAATLGALRRALAEGAEAVVASPRPSAARHVLLASKPLGRQLTALRRREGCDGVVVCVEPGWPLLAPGYPGPSALLHRRPRAAQRRAAQGLANALLGFSYAEVVVTGEPSELASQLDALAVLWPVAHQLSASSEALAADLVARLTQPGWGGRSWGGRSWGGAGAPSVRVVEPYAYAGLPPSPFASPGPLEPGELLLATRARRALGRLSRRALGRHAPAVRAQLGKLLGFTPYAGRQR